MLESLLAGRPPVGAAGQVMFMLSDFNAYSDIVDKGPQSIPLTIGPNVTVGKDSRGTYINFPGGNFNNTVKWAGTKLGFTELEINITAADIYQTGGQYGSMLFDTRPAQSNGAYFLITVDTSNGSKRQFSSNVNSVDMGKFGPSIRDTEKFDLKIRFLKKKTQFFCNGVLILESTAVLSPFVNQNPGLGYFAWGGVGGTMPFIGKVYYFDIRKIS